MGVFHDDLGTYEMPSMALASQTLARFFMTIFGTVRICDLPLQRMSVAPALPAPGVVLVDGRAKPPRHSCSPPLAANRVSRTIHIVLRLLCRILFSLQHVGLSAEMCTLVVAISNNAGLITRTQAGGPHAGRSQLHMRRACASETIRVSLCLYRRSRASASAPRIRLLLETAASLPSPLLVPNTTISR